jgi:hypothetical protein
MVCGPIEYDPEDAARTTMKCEKETLDSRPDRSSMSRCYTPIFRSERSRMMRQPLHISRRLGTCATEAVSRQSTASSAPGAAKW